MACYVFIGSVIVQGHRVTEHKSMLLSVDFAIDDSHRIFTGYTPDFWFTTENIVTLAATLTLEICRVEYRS